MSQIIWQLFNFISDSEREVGRVEFDAQTKVQRMELNATNQAEEITRLRRECFSQETEINILKKTFGEFQKRMTMK